MRERELIHACKKRNLIAVQELLVSPRSAKLMHRPTIEEIEKYKEVIQVNHIDINTREVRFKMTPLMIACLQGSKDIVIYLIYFGANVNLKDVKGNTALQLSIMKQRFHVIHTLLHRGANVNDVNASGWNSLITAVNHFHEDNSIMLLMLLKAGVKTEHKDNNGLTAIDHAVKKNKINAIRIILNYNPKMALYCSRALVSAAIKGQFDIILLLLNYGINPNKIDVMIGTGPQHEAVRYDSKTKDERSREIRLKIVKYLALYGADPELTNTDGETPLKLASMKPAPVANLYINALQEFQNKPHKSPKFVNAKAQSLNELLKIPKYPILSPRPNWTRQDFRFCTQSKYQSKTDVVTNLIDGDYQTMWTVASGAHVWVIFDLKAYHIITKIRIYGWKSKEMPAECQLQASCCLEGPWSNIQSFKCQMLGSGIRSDPGVAQDFDGFIGSSRYWRLVVLKNHGASHTSFHGIEFFGYDTRIGKLMEELQLLEYEHLLATNDFNQIEALVNCSPERFALLPIKNENDKAKLWNFLLVLRKKLSVVTKLDWQIHPPIHCLVGQQLPSFSVISNAYLTDTLQLLCHGGAVINGDLFVDLEPGGMDDPSMAIFNNVTISTPGKFIFEVRSVADSTVTLTSIQPIIVYAHGDPSCPPELLKPKVVPRLPRVNSLDEDSEDSAFTNLYDNTDFTDRTSRMRINKWISKSLDMKSDGSQTDYDANESFNSPNITRNVYITSNKINLNDQYQHKPKLPTSANSNRELSNYNNKTNNQYSNYNGVGVANRKSPPQMVNGKYEKSKNGFMIYTPRARQQQQQQQQQQQPPSLSTVPNGFVTDRPIAKRDNQTQASVSSERMAAVEYEEQVLTIEFTDEIASTVSEGADGTANFMRTAPPTEPKSEARVFVNNPFLKDGYYFQTPNDPLLSLAEESLYKNYDPENNMRMQELRRNSNLRLTSNTTLADSTDKFNNKLTNLNNDKKNFSPRPSKQWDLSNGLSKNLKRDQTDPIRSSNIKENALYFSNNELKMTGNESEVRYTFSPRPTQLNNSNNNKIAVLNGSPTMQNRNNLNTQSKLQKNNEFQIKGPVIAKNNFRDTPSPPHEITNFNQQNSFEPKEPQFHFRESKIRINENVNVFDSNNGNFNINIGLISDESAPRSPIRRKSPPPPPLPLPLPVSPISKQTSISTPSPPLPPPAPEIHSSVVHPPLPPPPPPEMQSFVAHPPPPPPPPPPQAFPPISKNTEKNKPVNISADMLAAVVLRPSSQRNKTGKTNNRNTTNVSNRVTVPSQVLKSHEIETIEVDNDQRESVLTNNNTQQLTNETNKEAAAASSRYIKQQGPKGRPKTKSIEITTQNGDGKHRETPSPYTIDRIVDEAFDYISIESPTLGFENKLYNGLDEIDNMVIDNINYGINTVNNNNNNNNNEAKEIIDDDVFNGSETFTEKAKKKLQSYHKSKKDSLTNSSINSISNLKN